RSRSQQCSRSASMRSKSRRPRAHRAHRSTHRSFLLVERVPTRLPGAPDLSVEPSDRKNFEPRGVTFRPCEPRAAYPASMAADAGNQSAHGAARAGSVVLLTLASAQFLMTLDTSVMNVSIATVAKDVGTTVTGIQTAITMYTLVMAAFMITGGKIGEIIGRKR